MPKTLHPGYAAIALLGFILAVAACLPSSPAAPADPVTVQPGSPIPTPTSSPEATATSTSPTAPASTLTFIVRVPETTPEREPIVLHYDLVTLVLERIGPYTHSGTIDVSDRLPDETIVYGYSRGGRVEFGEYGFWGLAGDEMPRRVRVGDGDTVNDEVTRWKWLPTEPLEETDIPSLAGVKRFEPRPEFWKGAYMPDFWAGEGAWPINYEQTIANLKEKGFDWIALKPPVSQVSDNPPKFVLGEAGNCPSYPDSALREHIRVFKDAGLRVLVSVQLCPITFEGKDEAWWRLWYDEAERIVQYHADLAREEGADALVIAFSAGLPGAQDHPPFASEAWARILDAAESAGLPLSFSSGAWGTDVDDPRALPYPLEEVDFMGRLDFFEVGIHNTLFIDNTNPTQTEVDEAVEKMLDRLDYLHELTGKPVVLGAIAYHSLVGAGLPKGPEVLYEYEDPDVIWDKYGVEYSAEQQAMIYEAIMKQVAEKPYVQGVFTWGYGYVDAPLAPSESIRGKMAERILAKWFESID